MSALPGTVVALQANYLEVELEAAPEGVPPRLLCTRRTRLNHRGAAARCGAAGKVCCGKRVRNAVGAAAAAAGVQSCDCCVSSASLPCFCGLYKAIQTPAISLVSYMPLARRSAIARNRQPASLAAPQSEDKRTCVHPLGLEIMEWESEAPAMIEEPVNQSKRRRRWRRSGRCRSSAKR